MSRMPTFRRRFRSLVKVLYLEAIQTGLIGNQDEGSLKPRRGGRSFFGRGNKKGKDTAGRGNKQEVADTTEEGGSQSIQNNSDMV